MANLIDMLNIGEATVVDSAYSEETLDNFYYWSTYHAPTQVILDYPPIWPSHEDKGKKAYGVAKALQREGFVKVGNVREFCKLMDFLMEEL